MWRLSHYAYKLLWVNRALQSNYIRTVGLSGHPLVFGGHVFVNRFSRYVGLDEGKLIVYIISLLSLFARFKPFFSISERFSYKDYLFNVITALYLWISAFKNLYAICKNANLQKKQSTHTPRPHKSRTATLLALQQRTYIVASHITQRHCTHALFRVHTFRPIVLSWRATRFYRAKMIIVQFRRAFSSTARSHMRAENALAGTCKFCIPRSLWTLASVYISVHCTEYVLVALHCNAIERQLCCGRHSTRIARWETIIGRDTTMVIVRLERLASINAIYRLLARVEEGMRASDHQAGRGIGSLIWQLDAKWCVLIALAQRETCKWTLDRVAWRSRLPI